jgi:CDGSH-type Zn-finger protein
MTQKTKRMKIKVCKDGPYTVYGGVPLSEQIMITNEEGLSVTWREGKKYPLQEEYDLCRCGQSKNKPFCDGSHSDFPFDGTETAAHEPFETHAEAKTIGPELELTDVPVFCAVARFCDRAGGAWDNTKQSDDPISRQIAIQEVFDCPAGRLVLHDKEGNLLEPAFQPSIGLVIDTVEHVPGPIWVRGGIPIEASDGFIYEVRNRVTLCRCGQSNNKPFCDGRHTELEED